ncbi:ribonuclease E inhibitor RraB [Thalassomonas sp. M1454]|uniref:ribonuclease E inhibitor RraB n=1 Tax=Thalassomonas sp. M1454 TaxID=2594477 RepID=UPI00117E759F|nr:ribonuclease E inhibitor RraB [Thalassomonas sp. M1454]TRX55894.1 ribonuclease E inhibitor RraB [Thalassomonas sp. M1454]
MNFPNDENGSVLNEMHQAGVDLTKVTTVKFFQLFEDEKNARAMAEHLETEKIAIDVEVHPDKTSGVWDVDCCIEILPSYENIVSKEAMFEKLARKFDGYNDGWGIAVDD